MFVRVVFPLTATRTPQEDKTNEVSLAYWFRTVDLNCDGIITADEMQHFYSEQMQRMADLNLEVVPFQDIMSQMCVVVVVVVVRCCAVLCGVVRC